MQTLSRRYYESGRHRTHTGSNTDDMEMPCNAPEKTTAGSSERSQSQDSCGQILHRTEFAITVEYRKGPGDKYEIQPV